MRAATTAVKQAIADHRPTLLLAEFDFPWGVERYHSGVGTLAYNGHNWHGTGGLASVGGVSSETSAFIQTITFNLAVDESTILAMEGEIRGREAVIWMAWLDEHGQVIPDPVEIVAAKLDVASQKIEGGGQVITITGQTGFYTLSAPTRYLWSNDQQQFDFPGDTGWDRAPQNATKEVTWSPP